MVFAKARQPAMFALGLLSCAPLLSEGARVRVATSLQRQLSPATIGCNRNGMIEEYDVIVVGGGPAGVEAAVEAASFADRVGLIEPKDIFGVPTGAFSKALRTTAVIAEKSKNYSFAVVKEQIDDMFNEAKKSLTNRLESAGVVVIKGKGKFSDEALLEVVGESGEAQCRISAATIFLATGSKASSPRKYKSIADDMKPFIFDSDTISDIAKIPKHIVINGGGIVAIEFAMFFSALGARVTLVVRSTIKLKMTESLPMDHDLTAALMKSLDNDKVTIRTHTNIPDIRLNEEGDAVNVTLQSEELSEVVSCDAVLFAIGRKGNSEDLGLENIGVEVQSVLDVEEGTFVLQKPHLVPRVYAIGDIVDGKFASVAKQQAHIAVQHWERNREKTPSKNLFHSPLPSPRQDELSKTAPIAIWSLPETSGVGETEESLDKKNVTYGVEFAYYTDIVRGVLEGATKLDHEPDDGSEHTRPFLKLIYDDADDKNHKILGVHIFGEMANDLVLYGLECITQGKTLENIADMSFPAVTYHELYSVAARNVLLKNWEEFAPADCKSIAGGRDRERKNENSARGLCKCKRGFVLGKRCPKGHHFRPGDRYYSKRTLAQFQEKKENLNECKCEWSR